jgi:hypothetical protein
MTVLCKSVLMFSISAFSLMGAYTPCETAASGSPGMNYVNPIPVMSNTITIYPVWYGNWTAGSRTQALIKDFVANVGMSSWWWVLVDNYCDGTTNTVSSNVSMFSTDVYNNYSAGVRPATGDVQFILQGQLANGTFPDDPNGIYVVFLDAMSNPQTGCSYHSNFNSVDNSHVLRVAVVSPNCQSTNTTPNFDPIADHTVTSLAYELAGTVTNPGPAGPAWFGCSGAGGATPCGEVQEICAGYYDSPFYVGTDDSGVDHYGNVWMATNLDGHLRRAWMIQGLWQNYPDNSCHVTPSPH